LNDPALPGLAVLTGDEASGLVSAALDPDDRVLDVNLVQIRYVPGKSVVAQFSVKVQLASGGTTRETIVAASGRGAPSTALTLSADGIEIALWRYPNDPALPGLAAAADPAAVIGLLGQLGAAATDVRLRRRAYRPGRRAVIEAITPQARIFIKVIRPSRVAALQDKHTVMAEHLPVPHSLGWSEDRGLVALQAMPGKTLRNSLESGKRRLPDGPELLALLDSIPAGVGSSVKGPVDRAANHAGLLAAVTPQFSARLAALVKAVSRVGPEPEVPVHGDFHSSQILVRDGSVAGLIDVDTAGRGERSNDLAVMLAHLATLSLASKSRRNIDRYGTTLMAAFDEHVDPRDLRLRTAAAVLGFATGPFRVQQQRWVQATERRVALAEQWVDSAQRASSSK